jgi:hypothetical protein
MGAMASVHVLKSPIQGRCQNGDVATVPINQGGELSVGELSGVIGGAVEC